MAIKDFGKKCTVIRKKGDLPSLPYGKIKDHILGTSYSLTIAFIDPKKALELNETTRGKNYIPNILSFPLSKDEGEIYICLSAAHKSGKELGYKRQEFLHLLLIHGALHLKGHDHGSTMEDTEERLLHRFYRGEK